MATAEFGWNACTVLYFQRFTPLEIFRPYLEVLSQSIKELSKYYVAQYASDSIPLICPPSS